MSLSRVCKRTEFVSCVLFRYFENLALICFPTVYFYDWTKLSSKTPMAKSTSSLLTYSLNDILAEASAIRRIDSICLTAIPSPLLKISH